MTISLSFHEQWKLHNQMENGAEDYSEALQITWQEAGICVLLERRKQKLGTKTQYSTISILLISICSPPSCTQNKPNSPKKGGQKTSGI